MKRKQIIAFVSAAALAVTSLAGCGKTEEKTEPAPERTYITINSGKDTNAADDSVKKEETKDSEETACPEPTDEKDSVKEENVPEEKTSSVVVEDDTEEGKTE